MLPQATDYTPDRKAQEEAEIPITLADFITSAQPESEFQIILKRHKGEGKGTLRTYAADEVADAEPDAVGREFGPGCYQWNLSWYSPSQQRKVSKSFTQTLAPDHYSDEHEASQAEKAKRRAARNPQPQVQQMPQPQQVDIVELAKQQMQSAMEMAALLKPAPPPAPAPDTTTPMLMQMMVNQMEAQRHAAENNRQLLMGIMGAAVPVIVAIIQRPKANEGVNPMGMFTQMIDMAKGIVDVKQLAAPEEKESVAERLVTMVSNNLPDVLKVVTMRAEERQKSLGYQVAMQHPAVQAANADPEIQQQAAEALAEKIGLKKTRDIAAGLGWTSVTEQLDEAISKRREAKAQVRVPRMAPRRESAPETPAEPTLDPIFTQTAPVGANEAEPVA